MIPRRIESEDDQLRALHEIETHWQAAPGSEPARRRDFLVRLLANSRWPVASVPVSRST